MSFTLSDLTTLNLGILAPIVIQKEPHTNPRWCQIGAHALS